MTLPPLRSASKALERVPSGARIVASPGMGEPTTLLEALPAMAPGRRWTICSGLMIGKYPFLPAVKSGDLAFETWHVTRPVQDLVAAGTARFIPARASEIPRLLASWRIGAAVVRVSPPAADGTCSLGPSTSYAAAAIRAAHIVIAEVDPAVPRTCGDSLVPVSVFDSLVDSRHPIPEYRSAADTAVGRQIAAHVTRLLPRNPTLQVGIGAIPEAIVRSLADADVGRVRFVGLAIDPMVDLFDAGVLCRELVVPNPAILSPEMHGSRKLLEFSDRNPAIGMYPSSISHDSAALGRIDRFVSINSALEVDLHGNVNSEVLNGRQFSGTGGSLDYADAAARSRRGLRIVALPSTSSAGSVSRIVGSVGAVTIPRTMIDAVVTEHGVARISGMTSQARAEALLQLADPRHRAALT